MQVFEPRRLVDVFGLRNASVRGDELVCSCPYSQNHRHGDSNPSFGISLETGLFSCFGCHESGNLTKLAQDVLNVDPIEATRLLYADVSQDDLERAFQRRQVASKPISPLESSISKWARNRHPYWKSRGLNDDTVGAWQLGYSPEMNRVTIPVAFRGETVGWTARRVDDIGQAGEPKWKSSPDLPRNRILFGMDKAESDTAILVEAPLSAIMLSQYGIPGAVASFGCELGDGQALLLRCNFDKVLVFYDPDEAGRRGTARAIERLQPFMPVSIVRPTRDDPAAMTKEEDEAAVYGDVVPSFLWF